MAYDLNSQRVCIAVYPTAEKAEHYRIALLDARLKAIRRSEQ